ncbi:hypothetical protein ABTY59_31995 [Streptomyces sp. NPDC096079]|uniref:hypothetical protein n=1 Tax=Streptomyces sp. NPDC096079 TaxID=3155820 RepID=UPI0033288AB4
MSVTLARDTRPFFVLLSTDKDHVRTVAHVAAAPCDVRPFTEEHEEWMETAMHTAREVVAVYATDYESAREIALDDTRPSAIVRHPAYGLQGMPRTAPQYAASMKTPREAAEWQMGADYLRRLLLAVLAIDGSRAWAEGRTVHAESPSQRGTVTWEFNPAD